MVLIQLMPVDHSVSTALSFGISHVQCGVFKCFSKCYSEGHFDQISTTTQKCQREVDRKVCNMCEKGTLTISLVSGKQ